MVGTQVGEQHVEGDSFCALSGKFLDKPAINLARPFKPITVAELAIFHGGDAGFINRDIGEVRGDGRGEFLGGTDAQIVSHAFQTIGEIRIPQADAANEREDGEG